MIRLEDIVVKIDTRLSGEVNESGIGLSEKINVSGTLCGKVL
jgi:hypothetical protein